MRPSMWWLCCPLGLVLAACTDPEGPAVVVTPMALDFGEVSLGDTAELSLLVSNDAAAAATISFSIAGEGPFSLQVSSAVEVTSDADRSVFVDATPIAEGQAEDTLVLAWTGGQIQVPLTVTGVLGDVDADSDGYTRSEDCDDTNAAVNPGATESCNGIDDDCSGTADDAGDADADGASSCDDCDDADPNRRPGANEACDSIDNDCDDLIDEVFNQDSDAFTTCQDPVDCDDLDPNRYPGAPELCNGLDDDCNSTTDDGFDDLDDDGAAACLDCDDTDPTQRPGIPEVCDGQDSDCDGAIDDGCPPVDTDGDGVATTAGDCDDNSDAIYPGAEQLCDGLLDNDCNGPDSNEADADADGVDGCDVPEDCDDFDPNNFPGNPEVCDGFDNNCSGDVESIADNDSDGFSPCAGDCDDGEALALPGGVEICDGIDNDCQFGPDDTSPDADLDGVSACADCDDFDPTAYPGATEVCDAGDNDCDGSTDEGFDVDGDGTTVCGVDGIDGNTDDDCNDLEFLVEPGAAELCDGMDTNCDGSSAGEQDLDGDGLVGCAGDCVETAAGTWSAQIHVGAAEACDGWDTNCSTLNGSGAADQANEQDNDGDGYIDCAAAAGAAVLPVGIIGAGDCVDSPANAAAAILHPGVADVCDGWDTDCSAFANAGAPDQATEVDEDGDGYLGCGVALVGSTPPSGVLGAGDCVDSPVASLAASAELNPAAAEVCDGWDTDCTNFGGNGVADESSEQDDDGDGYLPCSALVGPASPPSGVVGGGDCMDSSTHAWSDEINPAAAELCDGWDTNCSVLAMGGAADLSTESDDDGDGFIECGPLAGGATLPSGVGGGGDCDDGATALSPTVNPGAAELCDGVDTNCTGSVSGDEIDSDGDDTIECGSFVAASSAVTGLLAGDDCDDADADYNVLAAEGCGDPDYDCDTVAEDCLSCSDVITDHPGSPSGLYDVDPDGVGASGLVEVYCDMTTDGGGWTLIQRTTSAGADNQALRTGYASFYGTSVGSSSGSGVMRLAGQWWDDLAGASAEIMVEHTLAKAAGGSCTPLRYRVANGTLTVPVSGDPTIVVATDPSNVVNATSSGGTRTFSTTDSGPKSTACVNGQQAVPWFFLTDSGCGTTLPTYFYSSYPGSQARPSVWYSNLGTDLSGSTVVAACGGDAVATIVTSNWYSDTSMAFYVR